MSDADGISPDEERLDEARLERERARLELERWRATVFEALDSAIASAPPFSKFAPVGERQALREVLKTLRKTRAAITHWDVAAMGFEVG